MCYLVPQKYSLMDFNNSLSIFVMPLSGDWVLLKQGRDPLLTLGLSFTGGLPLSLLQDEFLVGGFSLILVVDGSSDMLPQSGRVKGNKVCGHDIRYK